MEVLQYFGLTKFQLRILLSLEALMVRNDALAKEELSKRLNPFVADHGRKWEWYEQFENGCKLYLEKTEPFFVDEDLYELQYHDQKTFLKQEIEKGRKGGESLWRYLVLMECALFIPYYPLSEEDAKKKKYKGLEWDEDVRKKSLETVSEILGLNPSLASKYQESYKDIFSEMEGIWKKVMFASVIAAAIVAIIICPFVGAIGAWFAPAGLYGAAAISSGLAVLGGGAIAAGGFGMMGGMAVIIGGGFLLGGGATGATVTLALTNPAGVKLGAVKIAVAVKDIVIGQFNDTELAFKILEELKSQKQKFQKLLFRIIKGENVSDEIPEATLVCEEIKQKDLKENLEKNIKYLSKLIEYIEKLMKIG